MLLVSGSLLDATAHFPFNLSVKGNERQDGDPTTSTEARIKMAASLSLTSNPHRSHLSPPVWRSGLLIPKKEASACQNAQLINLKTPEAGHLQEEAET